MKLETVSFGGLGDSVLVSLKLKQLLEDDNIEHINHLFVESNQKTLDWIKEYMIYTWKTSRISFSFEHDENYQENFSKWKDRKPLNTACHGEYIFPGNDFSIKDPFFKSVGYKPFDVCIQASAGAKSNREWKFDPIRLKKILELGGKKVVLVGTDDRFKDDDDPLNFCRSDVSISTSIIAARSSNIFVGLSGFLTYDTLAHKVNNVHLKESDDHDKHYIHKDWEEFRYSIEFGSLQEVIKGLRYWGTNV